MPRKRRIEPFFLIITDRDQKLFNVVGPMTDDTLWNERVCKAQERQRQVNCQSIELRERAEVIAEVKRQLGLEYSDEILV